MSFDAVAVWLESGDLKWDPFPNAENALAFLEEVDEPSKNKFIITGENIQIHAVERRLRLVKDEEQP